MKTLFIAGTILFTILFLSSCTSVSETSPSSQPQESTAEQRGTVIPSGRESSPAVQLHNDL